MRTAFHERMADTSQRAAKTSARNSASRAALRRQCPNCGLQGWHRRTLPLHAPLPPVGACVLHCIRCNHEETVVTADWEAGA